jgi:hypothetical protein
VIAEKNAGDKLQLENSTARSNGSALPADPSVNSTGGGPETQPVPQIKPGEMKVEMEAPLVFSGKDRVKAKPTAPPSPMLEAVALPLARGADPLPPVVVLPPKPDPKRANKGFFGHIKGFFGGIFR